MKVMIYDATDTKPGLELADSWAFGGKLYKQFNKLDKICAANSFKEARDFLVKLDPIDRLEFWGHGNPGNFFINGIKMDPDEFFKDLPQIRDLIWFRSCGTIAGTKGKSFALTVAARTKTTVAGHTHLIGPLQSGLHTLKPGSLPSWSNTEGLDKKGNMKSSYIWSPNTISCLHSEIPKGW